MMGLLRTMSVLREERGGGQASAASEAESLTSQDRLTALSGSWNRRIRRLSSPVVYLTALLA